MHVFVVPRQRSPSTKSTACVRAVRACRRLPQPSSPTRQSGLRSDWTRPSVLISCCFTHFLRPTGIRWIGKCSKDLRRAADLGGDRSDRCPSGWMLMLVIQHLPDRPLAQFRGELVRRVAHGGSSFSGFEPSGKPGAVQTACAASLSRYAASLPRYAKSLPRSAARAESGHQSSPPSG